MDERQPYTHIIVGVSLTQRNIIGSSMMCKRGQEFHPETASELGGVIDVKVRTMERITLI